MKKTTNKAASKARASLLVCITEQQECERLIRAGYDMLCADESLRIFSVLPKTGMCRSCGETLEEMFAIARELGAEMVVYYSDNPAELAKRYVMTSDISRIVAGMPSPDGDFVQSLSENFELPITIVSKDGKRIQYNSIKKLA